MLPEWWIHDRKFHSSIPQVIPCHSLLYCFELIIHMYRALCLLSSKQLPKVFWMRHQRCRDSRIRVLKLNLMQKYVGIYVCVGGGWDKLGIGEACIHGESFQRLKFQKPRTTNLKILWVLDAGQTCLFRECKFYVNSALPHLWKTDKTWKHWKMSISYVRKSNKCHITSHNMKHIIST